MLDSRWKVGKKVFGFVWACFAPTGIAWREAWFIVLWSCSGVYTNMSLRFVGLWKAAIGGSVVAFLHLSERCSTGRCFRRMLEMLGSAGLYVRTKGIFSVSVFLFWCPCSVGGLDPMNVSRHGEFRLHEIVKL